MKLLGKTSLHVGNEDLSNAQYKKKRHTRQDFVFYVHWASQNGD